MVPSTPAGGEQPPARPRARSAAPTFEEALAEVLGPDASDRWDVHGWWFRHRLDLGDRAVVLHRMFLDSDPAWLSAFIVMLLLSGGIATLGLSQDSAATVIGSMVVAPLGGPIVALGATIALVWPHETVKMGATIVAGAAMVVLLAYVIGLGLPQALPTAQILARTSPDLRDLGVALLAGAAGAYAQTRASLSSALVGVAIAVALVPPLAAAGLLLEGGHYSLATGALTLFAANLVGITVAVAITLLLTRYAPLPRLRPASAGLVAGLGALLMAAVAVALPLAATYRNVARSSQTLTSVYQQVGETLGPSSPILIRGIEVDGSRVIIDLSSTTGAPPASRFAADLEDELGPGVTVDLR